MQSVHTLLKLAQLRWTGHVTRMPDERLPKKIFYGELQVSKRSHGSQKKRYNDTLKASLKDFNIPTESWEQIAQDRIKWRGLIRRGAGEYDAKRTTRAEQKRAQRKARAKASPTELSSSDLSCSICNSLELRLVLSAILEHTNNNWRPRWLSWMRRPTGDQEVAGSIPAEVGNIISWRLIIKYFLRSFSPFR